MKQTTTLILLAILITGFGFSQTENPPPAVAQTEGEAKVNTSAASDEDEIVDFPDKEAEFKGKEKGLSNYINSKVRYPEEAIRKNISGKVYLSFVIEKNGAVSNVKIEKSAHPLLDKEAKRLVQNMPKWKPGKLKFRKVRTRCRLPIVFTLH